MIDINGRVAKGAKWLDEVEPGWFDLIDLNTLDISSNKNCILGQIAVAKVPSAGNYFSIVRFSASTVNDGFFALRAELGHLWMLEGKARERGFICNQKDEPQYEYAWAQEIIKRQEEAA